MLHSDVLPAKIMDMPGRTCALTKSRRCDANQSAFTLIEVFVVAGVIIILLGLAFPAFHSVQNSARKTQAKNDLVQIVTAVNAFYTEYGKYPLPASAVSDATAKFGGGTANLSGPLFNDLRGVSTTLGNTRQIVFISPPDAKDQTAPRNGIATAPANRQLYDPWGTPYFISIDWNYDNQIPNPYTLDTGAGGANIRQGVIAWSLGANKLGGSGAKSSVDASDDVISWQ